MRGMVLLDVVNNLVKMIKLQRFGGWIPRTYSGKKGAGGHRTYMLGPRVELASDFHFLKTEAESSFRNVVNL
jgi:hypothetical protein